MNVLSLFDGISCAYIALERAKIKIDNYFASEIDPISLTISTTLFPDIIQLGDINTIDFHKLPKIDLVIFGSPCQDISGANNKRRELGGLYGSRSGLFWVAIKALEILKPSFFLFENVASMDMETKRIIGFELSRFGSNSFLGVEPVLFNSSLVSAQYRERLYFCNWNFNLPKDKKLVFGDILENYPIYYCSDKSSALDMGYIAIGHRSLVQSGLVKLGYFRKKGSRLYSYKGKSPTIRAGKKGAGGIRGYILVNDSNYEFPVRYFTPRELCRLQTYPETIFDHFAIGKSRTRDYIPIHGYHRVFGNCFTVDVIKCILEQNKELYRL
jgi:DNA (cytosine-5)-methyltransferase 3A